MKINRLYAAFALAGAVGVCPSTGSAQTVAVSPAVMTTTPPCDTAPADATIFADGTSTLRRSGHGGYFYKGCGHYIVDLTVTPTSGATNFSADAYDLPSSDKFGSSRPTNIKDDCTRFQVDVILYKKNGPTTFAKLGDYGVKGVWSPNNYCTFAPTNPGQNLTGGVGFTFQPPTSTYDVYRIAVSARLRTSGQEVAVYSSKYVPGPH